MPSPIGHALAGVATALGAERATAARRQPLRATAPLVVACAALAALPDLDLLLPGMHRTVTHSVAAAVITTIVAAVVTRWVTGKVAWPIAIVCGTAYATHLLLDWLGADPNLPSGIQLLWPNRHWFIAPISIFPGTERRHFLTWAAFATNLKALIVECAVLGPIVAVLAARREAGRGGGADGAGIAKGGVGGPGR